MGREAWKEETKGVGVGSGRGVPRGDIRSVLVGRGGWWVVRLVGNAR